MINRIRDNHKAFAPMMLIVGLLAVAGIALAGWYIYDQNKDDDQTNNSNTTQQPTDSKDPVVVDKTPVETVGIDTSAWYLFDSSEYSMRIPDGWQLEYNDQDVLATSLGAAPLSHIPGQEAELKRTVGGRDGYFEMLIVGSSSEASCGTQQQVELDLELTGYSAIRCDYDGSKQIDPFPSRTYVLTSPSGYSLNVMLSEQTEDGSKQLLTSKQLEVIEAMLSTVEFK